MAPITSTDVRTLQADGATWEELAKKLRRDDKTRLFNALIRELPETFSRSEIIRLTFSTMIANMLLREAGISI